MPSAELPGADTQVHSSVLWAISESLRAPSSPWLAASSRWPESRKRESDAGRRWFGGLTMPSRRGVSIVETLVVIAIIGLMLGFLLPAVQSARTRALEIGCKNNLRQINLA